MLVGYLRVSSDSDRQSTALQRDALLAAGVDERHLFEDKASGTRDDRPGLAKALEFVKTGDCLVVWKLDRLGRSLSHLLTIVMGLRDQGVGFRSLTEQMDTTTAQGKLLFRPVLAEKHAETASTMVSQGSISAIRMRGWSCGSSISISPREKSDA
jgi:DNA invertase Pin-like site-specific DNA recombinase